MIKPTITIHLRTPIIACPPKTLVISQCPPPHSVFTPWCPPKSIRINECGLITKIPAICPPVTITHPPITVTCPPTTFPPTTFPTTIRTGPTQPINRAAAAGYDPYGVLGDASAGQEDAAGATYQAGYQAGYAAAVAELGEAMAATGAESAPGAEGAGGAGEDVQAGPGDVYRPYPRSLLYYCPRTVTEPSCFVLNTVNRWQCTPKTIGTPWCPIEVPPTWPRPIPTSPYLQPGPGGYGEDWGYDPYGQSPFQG